jgi:hypothetical protein
MQCIFCKRDSNGSLSIEHVIPESLGNTEHTLPPGVVCDKCNNYFASKVEGPLLSEPYFRNQCSLANIASKKGNAARVRGLHPQSRTVIEVVRNLDGSAVSIGAAFEKDEKRLVEFLLKHDEGRIYIPVPGPPSEILMSRFLAKVAVECVALKMLTLDDGIDQVIAEQALDGLRDYARRGPPQPIWPFHTRLLYTSDYAFEASGQDPYEVLHEWVLTSLGGEKLYFVLALFGVEYALNLAEREVKSYIVWLDIHSHRSPLYPHGLLIS